MVDDEDLDDSILNSVFEGRLERLNFTDLGDDYRFMGEEFGSHLTKYSNVEYAVFFDLMEDSGVDILIVSSKTLTSGEQGTALKAIYNNIDMSNFFIKVRMISDEQIAT